MKEPPEAPRARALERPAQHLLLFVIAALIQAGFAAPGIPETWLALKALVELLRWCADWVRGVGTGRRDVGLASRLSGFFDLSVSFEARIGGGIQGVGGGQDPGPPEVRPGEDDP